ncbi:MAG: aminotransferase class I/II-fold pyridoxal phosphate-dependent enzyme [Desulfosarcina sp.]|nr:aminotransferase class I/II-fold pyridoxal phosphate-dependent enzyme [Desulfobacterales bacterium]
MTPFARLDRLPPYVFATVNKIKMDARHAGEDIIDLGMGNPDQGTPQHIVDKMIEAVQKSHNHRYSASMGIKKLRMAISSWYKRRYDVDIDPESEAIVTIGAKEGISHLILVTIRPGDIVFTPNPTYPIHPYSAIISGGNVRGIPVGPDSDFFENLVEATKQTWPKPKVLIISYPHNPTTEVVDLEFFEKIVDYAKEHKIMVIHDFAYADLVFDGYKAPSFLQAKGARDVGVEFFSVSKSYNMPGWRVGFCVGNPEVIAALRRIKSYLDYGVFQPIQIAAIIALNGPQDCVEDIRTLYKERRDTLISALNRAGWNVPSPKGTMFVWAKIPDQFVKMGSVEFSKFLIKEAKIAVAPGLGFGAYGDEYVRFALIENSMRINQGIRGIRKVM